jgi:hypothetical protein
MVVMEGRSDVFCHMVVPSNCVPVCVSGSMQSTQLEQAKSASWGERYQSVAISSGVPPRDLRDSPGQGKGPDRMDGTDSEVL